MEEQVLDKFMLVHVLCRGTCCARRLARSRKSGMSQLVQDKHADVVKM